MLLMFASLLFIPAVCAGEDLQPDSAVQPSSKGENPPKTYRPFAGMDRDGRIPKKNLPDDIKNPGRWRYIPEGRIKPGNALERLFVSSFITPIVFYEQDVGAGGGVALTDIDFRQQRRREFAGIFLSYTTEGQQRYSMVWQRFLNHREIEGGGIAFEERSFIRGGAGYAKTLTLRFFGLGPDSTADDETSFTDEATHARFLIQQSFPEPGDKLVYRLSVNAAHHDLSEGYVSNVPSADEAYPVLFNLGDDYDILSLNGMLRYDTRDSQHSPYKGGLIELSIDGVPLQSNNSAAAITSLEGNWTFKVPGIFHDNGDTGEEHPPTDAIALGAFANATHGKLPFWALPSLGGRNTLRGYIQNRFTDRAAWHASSEYRFWVVPRGFRITDTIRIERVGLAFFYDIGTVSDSLEDFRTATIHDSYGTSLRFSLERTALFRADLGFSDEGMNFTFAYGLSF
ncbi:MAG: BamA/TamA family outer membrane protein [Deltaproteobacteria bacterium]|nr:BamA/TamA family outer membrane protein [Deltaproteobacteria bacterium]MBW2632570.1 BamA/TamA family outer membrane protein [Deltaproteobacteria bacterium]MBW2676001.1 BamA/TamA family outer membrane protein [Deltaproteobacteria bacterium]